MKSCEVKDKNKEAYKQNSTDRELINTEKDSMARRHRRAILLATVFTIESDIIIVIFCVISTFVSLYFY